ncbi:MAG: response regulator [bacterium]
MAQKNILIVSNDDTTVARLKSPLTLAGYTVDTVDDGKSALERIRHQSPAAIASELRLPEMDGLELCWVVRNQADLRHIPFLILSSSDDKEIELNCYRSGADALLIKPVSAREFLIRLEVLVSRIQAGRQNGSPNSIAFDGQLGEFLLLELIQWLHNNNKSGRLWLSKMYERGSILFDDGKIVMARLGDLEGESAIYQMFGWRAGKFEFEVGQGFETSNIKKSTIEILLECSKRMDEQQFYQADSVRL